MIKRNKMLAYLLSAALVLPSIYGPIPINAQTVETQIKADMIKEDSGHTIPTPEPTATQEAIPTPEPTTMPEVVPMPEPTTMPEVVPTPEPIDTPEVVPTPDPIDTPEVEPMPEPTAMPEVTPAPEPTLIPEVAPVPLLAEVTKAKGAPGKSTLSNNQWGGDYDGNYVLTWNMYYGNNATTWEVYEKAGRLGQYKLIHTATLEDTTPAAQSGVLEIKNKQKPGTYFYQVKLINSFGENLSSETMVTVGTPSDEKTLILGVDDAGAVLQFTIPQGTTTYALENVQADHAVFEVTTNNLSVVTPEIIEGNKLKLTAVNGGRASIKITEKSTGNVRYVGCRVKDAMGALPGMPNYVAMGSVSEDTDGDLSFWRDFNGEIGTNKRMDIRYIYINGGPLANGWKDWTSVEGDRARRYIKESLKLGMVPFFVYYNIPDSAEDYQTDMKHIQSDEYMSAYFNNLKYLLDICKEYAGDELVGLVLEPDFLGYMMQQSGTSPDKIAAKVEMVYTTGVLNKDNDPSFPNTVEGLVSAINYTINKYYPAAYYGWQFNIWSYAGNGDVPGQGLLHKTEYIGQEEGIKFIKNAARITAEYYKAAGVDRYGADFISIDKYGLDGAFESGAANNPKDSRWLWNADIWTNYLEYVGTLGEVCNLPVVLWQLPVGHLNQSQQSNPYKGDLFPDLTNAVGNYEDSAPTYFLGDTFKPNGDKRLQYFGTNIWKDTKVKVNGDCITWESHMKEAREKGIVAILFGAGVGASTDSVGAPPADAYWWIAKIQEYYKNPELF